MDAPSYLKRCLRTREEIEAFLKEDYDDRYDTTGLGWTYDADCGWILVDSVRPDGIDNSNTFYHYEPHGCRKRVNFADMEARIHTYGDSFTHCDQVSDGETWQEYLAAHLQEPVENYGIGGYSVYQAYCRMLKIEAEHPAEYIILNIYDDDHFRNLDRWRTIRWGGKTRCGYTLPYLTVDLAADSVEERDNICTHPEEVYRLSDLDWVMDTFADDPVLKIALASLAESDETIAPSEVPTSFGLPVGSGAEDLKATHTRAALRATRHVLERTEEFVERTSRKLLVVLSFHAEMIRATLMGEDDWDRDLLNFLETRNYPYVDLRDLHREEFASFNGDVESYIGRYYNGHYAPHGNYFCATALKNAVVDWLDPKPIPYLRFEEVVA